MSSYKVTNKCLLLRQKNILKRYIKLRCRGRPVFMQMAKNNSTLSGDVLKQTIRGD